MYYMLSSFVSAVSQLWMETTYHPERYYMRGPGPKWHEKQSMRAITGALIVLICTGVLSFDTAAIAQDSLSSSVGDELRHCMAITDESARLACYDKVTGRPPTPPAKGPMPPPLVRPTDKQK